jgi:hypothetical protein
MKKVTALMVALSFLFSTHQAQASINKSDRILIVVSELQTHGPRNLRNLYNTLEQLTRVQTNLVLGDDYKQIIYLNQAQATLSNFKNVLRVHASRADVKAIDVIMSLHGGNEKLYFREGGINVNTMAAAVTQASSAAETSIVNRMKSKLRMVYNLSCFGRSHNQAFREMGFDVSVGSNGVNANSEVEFIPVLTAWSFGSTFGGAFNASNNDGALFVADAPVRAAEINADSKKFFRGNSAIKITSDPQ